MKRESTNVAGSKSGTRADQQAGVRIILLVLIFFLLGLAAGAFLYHRASTDRNRAPAGAQHLVHLSDSTLAVLKRLHSPIQIRFYDLLDPTSVSPSLQAFAGRVDQLLSAYEQEASNEISVIRYVGLSDTNANLAYADGIQPFNLDKGDGCYLGITVAEGARRESLPRLYPEWEPALEFDLSRAIERVAHPRVPPQPPAATPAFDSNAVAAVKLAIPNLDSVSVEQGTQLLREAALKEFKVVVNETEAQLKEAQQRLAEAQAGKSEAEQQVAMKHLQEVQAMQAERLQQLGARLQSQIAALQRLKQQ